MSKEWNPAQLIVALGAAGTKGMTRSALEKKIPQAIRSRSDSIFNELKSSGALQGPFKKGSSSYYFAPGFAPSRVQTEALIDKALFDAGQRLMTTSELKRMAKGPLQIFFEDALAALKSEAKVVELKKGPSTLYVHRDTVLEQLRLAEPSAPLQSRIPQVEKAPTSLTLEQIRPAYERLKSEQGGISTVTIYDLMTRSGISKDSLHHLLLEEAKAGRVSLHRVSTTNFAPEVLEAGIRLEGYPAPLVTVVLKDQS